MSAVLLSSRLVPHVIAGAWFLVAFSTTLWVWGLDPVAFATPDEAVNRLAASLINEQGRPVLRLPFPDPEDLAHPRHWISLDDEAVPSYAPVALYIYALLLRPGTVGLVLVSALPASAVAAFAAGTAMLLPPGRQWLAALAPALGFPALYWLLRPWMNVSVLLVCVSWSFFFWVRWRMSGSTLHVLATVVGAGAAAAVRPDYAAYVLPVVLLFTLAAAPSQWKRLFIFITAAGVAAVAANLLLNTLITGSPLRAAYQIAVARETGSDIPDGPLLLLKQLVLPAGLPTLRAGLVNFSRYWLAMGPISLLLAGQLALVPLLRAQPRRSRVLYALGLLVMACFSISRIDPDVFGTSAQLGMVHHSIPRYWAPVYLLAALPPILFAGYCRRRVVFAISAALLCAVAGSSTDEVFVGQASSFGSLHRYSRDNERLILSLGGRIPADAMVYSSTNDKVLWSRWRVGTLGEPERTAKSMRRALDAHVALIVFEPRFSRNQYQRLAEALGSEHLALVATDATREIYRVEREP